MVGNASDNLAFTTGAVLLAGQEGSMSTVVTTPSEQEKGVKRPYPIIDCDVHPMMNSPNQLAPYLSAAWRGRLHLRDFHPPPRRVPPGRAFPGHPDRTTTRALPRNAPP